LREAYNPVEEGRILLNKAQCSVALMGIEDVADVRKGLSFFVMRSKPSCADALRCEGAIL
jgi:hypothetical protein